MVKIFTNPNKRCKNCNGREVIIMEEDGSTRTNLQLILGEYYCIDREECERNVEAENTEINFYDDKVTVTRFGREILKIDKGLGDIGKKIK